MISSNINIDYLRNNQFSIFDSMIVFQKYTSLYTITSKYATLFFNSLSYLKY